MLTKSEISAQVHSTYPLEVQFLSHQKLHPGSEICHYEHKICLQQNPAEKTKGK